MTKKVSVIVPIYNVEKFIEKTINSLINQTYDNIEIILVDDGSPDSSPQICDKYSKKDSRIKVIHKNNSGVSYARNTGIKVSSGDYIMFVDGDDYVEPDYVEYFVNLIKKTQTEMAISYCVFDIHKKNQVKKDFIDVISSEKAVEQIYLEKINVAVWNKIYSKEIISKYNILFDENIWYGEGMLFNIEFLQFIKNVGVGNKRVYNQVYNSESAMRKFSLESNYCGLRSLDIQKEKIKMDSKKILNGWLYHKRQFNVSILSGIIENNMEDKYKNEVKECIKNLKKDIFIPVIVNIPLKNKFYSLLISINPILFVKLKIKRKRKELKKVYNSGEKIC